jgi:hypothetical protein
MLANQDEQGSPDAGAEAVSNVSAVPDPEKLSMDDDRQPLPLKP